MSTTSAVVKPRLECRQCWQVAPKQLTWTLAPALVTKASHPSGTMLEGVSVGSAVGAKEGNADGNAVGFVVGDSVGNADGNAVGLIEGDAVGSKEGDAVGSKEGDAVGLKEGDAVGSKEGNPVGASVDAVGLSVGLDVTDSCRLQTNAFTGASGY